jgi:hypothetical protein
LTRAQARSQFKWTDAKLVALLTQVVDADVNAFRTYKAGGEKASQKAAWTDEPEGLLPLLFKHEAFKDVSPECMPKYTSMLQTIDRLLEVCPSLTHDRIAIGAHRRW